MKLSYRGTGPEAVLDVALEDDPVGLGEPEGLVVGDEGVAVGHEPGEDGGVDGASVLVDDGERRPGVLGHGHAAPGEDAVRGLVGDLDAERQLVANSHRLNLRTFNSLEFQNVYRKKINLYDQCNACTRLFCWFASTMA